MEQRITIDSLASENRILNTKIHHLEYGQIKLRSKIDNIQNKGLENCIILRGVSETTNEDTSLLMTKVYKELSKTINSHSEQEQLRQAKEMDIIKCCRVGRFQKYRTRPISREFQYQLDLNYVS